MVQTARPPLRNPARASQPGATRRPGAAQDVTGRHPTATDREDRARPRPSGVFLCVRMRETSMLLQGVMGRVGVSLGLTICAATSIMAAAAIWLFLTEPMTVASALNTGDLGRLATAVFGLVASAVRTLVSYL